jgi:hypothetical protein
MLAAVSDEARRHLYLHWSVNIFFNFLKEISIIEGNPQKLSQIRIDNVEAESCLNVTAIICPNLRASSRVSQFLWPADDLNTANYFLDFIRRSKTSQFMSHD